MKKKTDKQTEKQTDRSARSKANFLLDQWLIQCPEDNFERPQEFQGVMKIFKPSDFCIGRCVGPFVEICCGSWGSIFHIDEIEKETSARYYDPIRRLLELMICHPLYWFRVHYGILHEIEKAGDTERADMLAELDQIPDAQYEQKLKQQFNRFRVPQ